MSNIHIRDSPCVAPPLLYCFCNPTVRIGDPCYRVTANKSRLNIIQTSMSLPIPEKGRTRRENLQLRTKYPEVKAGMPILMMLASGGLVSILPGSVVVSAAPKNYAPTQGEKSEIEIWPGVGLKIQKYQIKKVFNHMYVAAGNLRPALQNKDEWKFP